MIEEIWKDIKNYEGYYQISNLGNVRSVDRMVKGRYDNYYIKQGQLIVPCYNKRVNIYEVHLKKDGQRKCCKIHRLVAEAFIPNDDPMIKTTVNHKDGNRANNCVDNLEWCSYSENEKHAYSVLNRTINSVGCKKRECISIEKDTGKEITHDSIAAASRYTGISETQIRRIACGECINSKYFFTLKNNLNKEN